MSKYIPKIINIQNGQLWGCKNNKQFAKIRWTKYDTQIPLWCALSDKRMFFFDVENFGSVASLVGINSYFLKISKMSNLFPATKIRFAQKKWIEY